MDSLEARVEAAINDREVRKIILEEIERIAAEKVNVTIGSLLNQMLSSKELSTRINKKIDAEFPAALDTQVRARAANFVSREDIGTLVNDSLGEFLEKKIVTAKVGPGIIPAAAINWKGAEIPGRAITGNITEFASNGISDRATQTELVLEEGRVIVRSRLVTDDLKVIVGATINNLNVTGNITVEGKVKFTNPAFINSIDGMITNRLNEWSRLEKLELHGGGIFSNGDALIENNALGSTVINSNLRTVGRLTKLEVAGETQLAGTLGVVNGRVGINTDQPAGVLSIWDEEAELTIRKLKSRTMFVGSSRDCNISFGVGGNPVLEITSAGASMAQVTIGGVTISTGIETPITAGQPGDLCINSRPDLSPAWAWRCIGGPRWIELR